MSRFAPRWLSAALAAAMILGGCSGADSGSREDHYQSAQVQGESARINLEQVQQAFFTSKGNDFNTWMGAFEKRVNEIYDGSDVVSIDADRKDNRLSVTGYVDKNAQQGFQAGDDKLFSIEQTGDAVNDQVPIRVSNGGGATYYEGHHSLLDTPFLQAMLISHMFGGWGGHYYTPHTRVVYLNNYRDTYRRTDRGWRFVRRVHELWYGQAVEPHPLHQPAADWPTHADGRGTLPGTWGTWAPFWAPDPPPG